ncbi:MAG: hypothetical protein R2788_23445 [Saprospiraceae bacterium]
MNWEKDKHTIVSTYYHCIDINNKELFDRLEKHYEKCNRLYPIIRFISERLSTVWFLTLHDKLWDADIIDRSVLEVIIKLTFILKSPDKNEFETRLNEYWNDLWEISSLKHSDQAKKQLTYFKDRHSQLAYIPLLLSEEEEMKLREKWNRKDRNRLTQKWSFSEMLFSLMKDYDGQPFDMLIGLAHEYRMCSHIAHGDESGIGMIDERKSRKEDEREAVHRGHFIKLLSNCLAYSSWVSLNVMNYLKKKINSSFQKIYLRLSEIKRLKEFIKKRF